MSAPRRRAGVFTFILGAAAALGGARLFAPRVGVQPDHFAPASGRGAPHTQPSGAALAAGYEPEDARAGEIGWIMALFAGSALTGILLMGLFLHVMHRSDRARETGLTAIQRTQTEPPLPRLQADPLSEIDRARNRQHMLLHSFAVVAPGIARIPIDRAMALTAGQPLDRADTQGDGRAGTPATSPSSQEPSK